MMATSENGDGQPPVLRRGAFVECLFPFHERPAVPGPVSHIVCLRTLVRVRQDVRAQVMFTTTSQAMISQVPKEFLIRITEASSRSMGMRNPFAIVVGRLATLPLDERWFPRLHRNDFIIAQADDRLKAAINRRYDLIVANHRHLVLNFGPRSGPSEP